MTPVISAGVGVQQGEIDHRGRAPISRILVRSQVLAEQPRYLCVGGVGRGAILVQPAETTSIRERFMRACGIGIALCNLNVRRLGADVVEFVRGYHLGRRRPASKSQHKSKFFHGIDYTRFPRSAQGGAA